MTELFDAALHYAAREWYIFPLLPHEKTPLTAHGYKDATNDAETIRLWWSKEPNANIGLDCERNRVTTIDVDADRGGLETWLSINPNVPTLTTQTGGGGLHFIYHTPEGVDIRNGVDRLGKGVDVRANGGYIVLPPSIHPNGSKYQWVVTDALAELPPALLERLTPKAQPPALSPRVNGNGNGHSAYARAALDDELARLRAANEGTRNDTLNRTAFNLGRLIGAGELDRAEVETALHDTAIAIGLTEREAAATIKSGLDAGIKEPRLILALPAPVAHAASKPTPNAPNCASAIPGLPDYARLTPEQEAAGATAGQWLDDYVTFAAHASPLTPRTFHTAAGLFAGALAIARRLHVRVSVKENTIYPNLYLLFVGQSTRPRKTTAERVLKGLLQTAGMSCFLLADRQTPEALQLDLTTNLPPTFDAWPDKQQTEWLQERAIAAQRGWLLAEASHLLDSFNRDYTNGLLPIVLDLYDCSDDGPRANTVSRGRQSVTKPYLSIFGATTFGAMAEHIQQAAHWHNGLWARFALVGTDNGGAWKFWPEALDYPPELVQRLNFIAFKLLPLPTARIEIEEIETDAGEKKTRKTVAVSPELQSQEARIEREAWAQWERYARAVSFDMLPEQPGAVPAKFYANYGRLGTMLIKVALILATFDAEQMPVTVHSAHVYRAQAIVETWRANLHSIFAKVNAESMDTLAEDIKAALAANGQNWTPRRALLRGLHKKWSEVEPIVNDLAAGSEIERQTVKDKPGRDIEEYRLNPTQD